MNRVGWVLVVFGVLVAAAIGLVLARPHEAEWTTASAAALDAFEAGREAENKLYHRDAIDWYARALEHDPTFFAAKVQLARTVGELEPERAEKLREDALEADRDRLSPREQFIFDGLKAFRDNPGADAAKARQAAAEERIERYLERSPDDTYVLAIKAAQLFNRGELEESQRIYQRLVELDPNFVLAYNQLGYIAMQMARFAEAEEHFTSYRFIAPDQANPHDSLGELFVILGRYDEAAASFERAIAIKSDFWNSYVHLMIVHTLTGDYAAAEHVIERAVGAGALGPGSRSTLLCTLRSWQALGQQDWDALLTLGEEQTACVTDPMTAGVTLVAAHRAASALGRFDLSLALEAKVGELEAKSKERSGGQDDAAVMRHMRGVRLACQGSLQEAENELRAADGMLRFMNADIGVFKLENRLALVEVLLARGHQAEAHALLSQVRTVNPTRAASFESDGLQVLGLRAS